MSKPHIVKTVEDSNGNNWCVNYNGLFEPGHATGKRECCKAGVKYESVAVAVEYTHAYYHSPKTVYQDKVARPCFKCESGLTNGCPKQQFRTPEENAQREKESNDFCQSVNVAREAILKELRRRFVEGPTPDNVTAPADISRFHKPQTNYFCGAGVMDCPICKTGKLKYSRSSYNGHVHARCSTEKCVSWME